MKYIKLLLPIILSISLYGQSIAEQWESSVQYLNYIKAMESGNLKEAINIKK